jgi:hypothetical protein
MRSVAGLITCLYDCEVEETPQEVYQLSKMLDQLISLAPSQARKAVGGNVTILRTLHRGHLADSRNGATCIETHEAAHSQAAGVANAEGTSVNEEASLPKAETAADHSPERSLSPSTYFRYEGYWESNVTVQRGEIGKCPHAAGQPVHPEPAQAEKVHQPRTFTYEIPQHTPNVICLMNHLDERRSHLAVECPEFMIDINSTERSQLMNDDSRCRVCWQGLGKHGAHPSPCPHPSYCQKCRKKGHHELLCTDFFVTKPKYLRPRGGSSYRPWNW